MIDPKQGRVRRGSAWGERLGALFSPTETNAMDWMERHTHILKSDKYSKVGLIELGGQTCYLKYYEAKSWGQYALFRLGFGRGFSSYDSALALLDKRIWVPKPLSCLLVPKGMMLLTEAIHPARDLKAEWLCDPDQAAKLMLMQQAGHTLYALHAAGYCHGDCKWSNFLWSRGQFCLVDLEAAESVVGGVLNNKKQLRDIARFVLNAEDLSVSSIEFQAFLRAYLDRGTISESVLVEAILPPLTRLRRRHEQHYGARGRRLIGE